MNNTYEISYTSKQKNEYNFEIKEMNEKELDKYINELKSQQVINIEVYHDDVCIYEKGEYHDYILIN